MSQIDKTRDNIRVSNIDDSSRKELFQKFIDAGGKVVKEKTPKPIIFDREKQKQLSAKLDNINQSRKNKTPRTSSYQVNNVGEFNTPLFLDSFTNKLLLFFSGTTNISGKILKNSFLNKFSEEYKIALIELQLLYLAIFHKNKSTGDKITAHLDNQKPLYFEIIEMTADLFDKVLISEILDTHSLFPNDKKKTVDYKTPLMACFKKIYPLIPYINAIYAAYDSAISLHQKYSTEEDISSAALKRKANNSIYIVFYKFLPKLYRLFCLYHGQNIPISDRSRIEEILLIGPDLKPGMRTLNSPSRFSENFKELSAQSKAKEEEQKKEAIEELKKKHKTDLADDIKRGLEMIKSLSFEELSKTYLSNRDNSNLVSIDDPYLKTYLLFLEFDRQYAYILTTSKIKYNIYYDRNIKYDIRSELLELMNSSRGCEEAARKYFNSVSNYLKFTSDKNLSKDIHLYQEKKAAELEKEKSFSGTSLKGTIRNFLDRLSDKIEFLLNDIKDLNRTVLNSKEIIQSDIEVDPNTLFTGKTVAEAFSMVNDYIQAFLFRISSRGDIFSNINSEEKPVSEEKTEEIDNNSSILNQLNDLF